MLKIINKSNEDQFIFVTSNTVLFYFTSELTIQLQKKKKNILKNKYNVGISISVSYLIKYIFKFNIETFNNN